MRICDECGQEILSEVSYTDDVGRTSCIPCAHARAKDDPDYGPDDAVWWQMCLKMHQSGLKDALNPRPPIPHDFEPGDLVVDKMGMTPGILEVKSVGGDYLGFHTPRLPEQQIGANFRGRLSMGRVDTFRHATQDEIRSM